VLEQLNIQSLKTKTKPIKPQKSKTNQTKDTGMQTQTLYLSQKLTQNGSPT
jgi:hypothetical protein